MVKVGLVKAIEDLDLGEIITVQAAYLYEAEEYTESDEETSDTVINHKNLEVLHSFRNTPMEVMGTFGNFLRVNIPVVAYTDSGPARYLSTQIFNFDEFEWVYLPPGLFPDCTLEEEEDDVAEEIPSPVPHDSRIIVSPGIEIHVDE